MSTLSIKVNIAGRTYPLTINREEEEAIRKAALAINKNIEELKANYAVRDAQDLLAMTALQFTTELQKETKSVEHEQLLSDLKDLDSRLSVFLKKSSKPS